MEQIDVKERLLSEITALMAQRWEPETVREMNFRIATILEKYEVAEKLSLLGIKARVIQGNTLTEPYTGADYPQDRVLKTPAYMGVLI